MDISDTHCHTSTTVVNKPANEVMAYIADGMKHNDWALGCLDRKQIGENLFHGRSLLDGGDTYVRLYPDFDNLHVYADVGRSSDDLLPRVFIRVVPGEIVDRDKDSCLVSLITWRWDMADEDWMKMCVSHATEMFIIRSKLESTHK